MHQLVRRVLHNGKYKKRTETVFAFDFIENTYVIIKSSSLYVTNTKRKNMSMIRRLLIKNSLFLFYIILHFHSFTIRAHFRLFKLGRSDDTHVQCKKMAQYIILRIMYYYTFCIKYMQLTANLYNCKLILARTFFHFVPTLQKNCRWLISLYCLIIINTQSSGNYR